MTDSNTPMWWHELEAEFGITWEEANAGPHRERTPDEVRATIANSARRILGDSASPDEVARLADAVSDHWDRLQDEP